MDKRLILVDGSSHVFRAYYALQRTGFSSPSGKPTHVLYGVLNMMKALRKQHPDSTIIIVFDGKGKGIILWRDFMLKADNQGMKVVREEPLQRTNIA